MQSSEFIYILEENKLEELRDQGSIHLELKGTRINNYYVFANKQMKFLVRKTKPAFFQKVNYTCHHTYKPKDARQAAFLHGLDKTEARLIVCLGAAGTGKTSLAMSYALHESLHSSKKIVLSKAAVPVGRSRAFGPVPGDVNQKYAPYLSSYQIVIKKILGPKSKDYIKMMFEKGAILYQPLEFVRGNTYENCTFIMDEVQNLSWHELKTVISRIGEGAKIILLGDIYQSDTHFRAPDESGIKKLLSSRSFVNSQHTFDIELKKQYRGPLADLIYKIDNE